MIFLISEIRADFLISEIDIQKFSGIRKSFSDIRKSFSDIRKSYKFLISENKLEFLISENNI